MDLLLIDGALFDDAGASPSTAGAAVGAVIAVGEAMGIGVGTNVLDTEQRLDAALEKGVPYGCGLALAEPIDAATVEQLIDESSTDGAG